MRKLLTLLFVLPLLVLTAPPAQAATCTIDPAPAEPVPGQVGEELAFFITVTGCESSNKIPSFKVVDGNLPTGTKVFSFAGSSGVVFGTPKTAGTFTATIQVKDEARNTDTETFTFEIAPAEAPAINEEVTPNDGTVGEPYFFNVFVSGGVQPYTFAVVDGALPPGLELPRRDNTISGTPTEAGTFTFTVQVTDDIGGTDEREYTITINP